MYKVLDLVKKIVEIFQNFVDDKLNIHSNNVKNSIN